jgi:hypothetical protein
LRELNFELNDEQPPPHGCGAGGAPRSNGFRAEETITSVEP